MDREPGGLQFIVRKRVRHDGMTNIHTDTHTYYTRLEGYHHIPSEETEAQRKKIIFIIIKQVSGGAGDLTQLIDSRSQYSQPLL